MTASSAARLPLEGLSILIIRPQRQAERLAQAIQAAGGEAVIFPTIEIQPLADDSALRALIKQSSTYQMAIFVSANAVEQGMPYLASPAECPTTLVFAAIGEATRKALQGYGIYDVLIPVHRYDSEGLLDLPEMHDIAGKRILIFRGEGGREVLADILRSRGAQVDYAVCYRRIRPQPDAGPLSARWKTGNIHAVSAMSLESLTNLYAILDESVRRLLAATPIFVPHPRIAEGTRTLGAWDVRVTGAGDIDLIEKLSSIHAG